MSQNDIIHGPTSQVQVYRVSIFLKIVLSIVAVFCIVLFSWFFFNMINPDGSGDKVVMLFQVIPILIGFSILFLIFRYRIEIHPDKIRKVSFRNTELPLNKIRGFRIITNRGSQTFVIHPNDPDTAKINIGEMIDRKEELRKWIRQNLTDLDAVDYQEEMNKITHDKTLGDTEEQRLSFLQRAKKAALVLNSLAMAACFWAIIYPRPYDLVIMVLLILPLTGMGFLYYFRGVMKFYELKEKSVYPNIGIALLMPSFILAFKAMTFKILDWERFWLPFICLSIIYFVLILYISSDTRRKTIQMLLLVFFCAAYSYGAVISLNCILDESAPQIYKARLIDKRVSHGKSTSYYFTISPWGSKNEESETKVGKGVYDMHQTGGDVEVITRHGRFEIPWYYVL